MKKRIGFIVETSKIKKDGVSILLDDGFRHFTRDRAAKLMGSIYSFLSRRKQRSPR